MLFSEPKIPQFQLNLDTSFPSWSFSALQRAENSSIQTFWNLSSGKLTSFSALQRAENSSIISGTQCSAQSARRVSVLFSEPKIPQSPPRTRTQARHPPVSVLFSEPKIPQSPPATYCTLTRRRFSALQRAENSSINDGERDGKLLMRFSALQRAENSSIIVET